MKEQTIILDWAEGEIRFYDDVKHKLRVIKLQVEEETTEHLDTLNELINSIKINSKIEPF